MIKYLDKHKVLYRLSDGTEYHDIDMAISILLKEMILTCGETGQGEITIGLLMNDAFIPAACVERIEYGEIQELYKMWVKNKKFGAIRFAAIRNKEKPRKGLVQLMKDAGKWDDVLDKLNNNYFENIKVK